jgi:hypothetical protein
VVYIIERNVSSDFHDDWSSLRAKKSTKSVFCKFQPVDLHPICVISLGRSIGSILMKPGTNYAGTIRKKKHNLALSVVLKIEDWAQTHFS